MEKRIVNRMPADKGIRFVTSMVKTQYIAEISGFCYRTVTLGMTHGKNNGCNTFYSLSQRDKLQAAIKSIARELLDTVVYDNGDVVSQLKELRKKLWLPFIFQIFMGKTKNWGNCRVSRKRDSMYNKFSSDDVRGINCAIQHIAITLMTIELAEDAPEEMVTPEEGAKMEADVD